MKGLTGSDFTDTSIRTFFKWNRAPFAKTDIDFIIKRQALLGSPDKPASAAAAAFFAFNPWPGDPAAHPVCLEKLMPFADEFEAAAGGYDLPVPFFVIQGRDDIRCPPAAARAFVERVGAPAKGYTAIDGGHFACFSNPAGFLNALDSDIRGLGISR